LSGFEGVIDGHGYNLLLSQWMRISNTEAFHSLLKGLYPGLHSSFPP
jgi:hypothetical protein